MHYGMDMACKSGTRIGAADGGTVTFAGYKTSFGYVVEIDHGGNLSTLYAHCSKLHVKRGDKVYQGQHIADVGSTGRSTGPHLHFEVHKNGVPQNPRNYI
jgi:murein DD-endopeptidase MepM/ murein hydrolase activator NlpD